MFGVPLNKQCFQKISALGWVGREVRVLWVKPGKPGGEQAAVAKRVDSSAPDVVDDFGGRGERGVVVLDDTGKHADPLEKRVERSVLAEGPQRVAVVVDGCGLGSRGGWGEDLDELLEGLGAGALTTEVLDEGLARDRGDGPEHCLLDLLDGAHLDCGWWHFKRAR